MPWGSSKRRRSEKRESGVQLPVVAVMLMLILAAIMAFDGLTRQPTLEIQVIAFVGVLLLAIDAIASGTDSMRDRRALLTLSWGVTVLIIAVVGFRIFQTYFSV